MKKTHLALVVASGLLVVGSVNARVLTGQLTPVALIVNIADGYQCNAGNYTGCLDLSANVTGFSFNGNYEIKLELPVNHYKYLAATPGRTCVTSYTYGEVEAYTLKYAGHDVVNSETVAYFTPMLNGKEYNDNIPYECYATVFDGMTFYTF